MGGSTKLSNIWNRGPPRTWCPASMGVDYDIYMEPVIGSVEKDFHGSRCHVSWKHIILYGSLLPCDFHCSWRPFTEVKHDKILWKHTHRPLCNKCLWAFGGGFPEVEASTEVCFERAYNEAYMKVCFMEVMLPMEVGTWQILASMEPSNPSPNPKDKFWLLRNPNPNPNLTLPAQLILCTSMKANISVSVELRNTSRTSYFHESCNCFFLPAEHFYERKLLPLPWKSGPLSWKWKWYINVQ